MVQAFSRACALSRAGAPILQWALPRSIGLTQEPCVCDAILSPRETVHDGECRETLVCANAVQLRADFSCDQNPLTVASNMASKAFGTTTIPIKNQAELPNGQWGLGRRL